MTDPNTPQSSEDGQHLTFRESLMVYLERRTLVMFGLGFASGLPYMLIFSTLSAWLRVSGLSVSVIAFFGLATLSFSLKFFWAPWVDRTKIPVLSQQLGHRRSWMLVVQAIIILGLWLIAGSNPAANLGLVAAFAVLVGFASATQDIVIDAWRIEAVGQDKQGAMAAAYQLGWRVAFIVATGGALWLADLVGWPFAYTMMAVFMTIGVASVLLAPRERQHVVRPIPSEGIARRPWAERGEWLLRGVLMVLAALIVGSGLLGNANFLSSVLAPVLGAEGAEALKTAWKSGPFAILIQVTAVFGGFGLMALACFPIPGTQTFPGTYLAHSFGDPLKDFFDRFKATAGTIILAMICVYRIADFVMNIMKPFYLDIGFSQSAIGATQSSIGVIATSIGVLVGGFAIARFGLFSSLLVGALAQPISNLFFATLTIQGPVYGWFVTAIVVDNISAGFAGTCLIAYMSSLTSAGFTATQYAFFSSLYSLPGKIIASLSGRVVEGVARNADAGGTFSPLMGLLAGLPEGTLADGAASSGVTPAALGAGYLVFFFYSAMIGVLGVLLTLIVTAQSRSGKAPAGAQPQSSDA